MANLYILDTLKHLARTYSEAKAKGFKVPKHTSPKFRGLLYTLYREPLVKEGINLDDLGALLGNKARWDVDFAKCISLSFMSYLLKQTQQQEAAGALKKFDSTVLDQAAYGQTMFKSVYLKSLSNVEISKGPMLEGATLFLDQPRTIAIKAKVQYPNVKKINDLGNTFEYMFKWLKLKYTKTQGGVIKITPFPAFQATLNPTTNLYTTIGQIESVQGDDLQFSYVDFGNRIRDFAIEALKLLTTELPSLEKIVEIAPIVDLVNILQGRNDRFYLKTLKSRFQKHKGTLFDPFRTDRDLPLFSEDPVSPEEGIRINGLEPFDNTYIVFGDRASLLNLANIGSSDIIVLRSDFYVPTKSNIYNLFIGDTESSDPLALIFTTKAPLTQISEKLAIFPTNSLVETADLILVEDLKSLLT